MPQTDTDFHFSPRANRAAEIAWRPWGREAFAEAREQHRPVLLAISAVWCHWCHVMDETSYSDDEVIAIINARFVPVRVDNDRRPDVNRRYNMGGWPTVAFLTPAGDLLTGATYLPPSQLQEVLSQVADLYAQHEAGLAAGREPVTKVEIAGEEGAAGPDGPAAPSSRLVDAIVRDIVATYDPLHGGLGTEPKFPQAVALRLLLIHGVLRDDARARGVAVDSLRKMAAGDIYDRAGAGFFRYATRRDWSEPHYEKMLEDNALLAALYLDAWQAGGGGGDTGGGGDGALRKTAEGVLGYLLGTLLLPDAPVFAGSQDADEEYYRLPPDERRARPAPALDATVYVEWNALAATALLRGSYLLGRDELRDAGLATLDYLWDHGRGRGAHGMVRYLGGPVAGLLDDQAAMIAALLEAHAVGGERICLARAEVLADWTLAHLTDIDGRFLDRSRVTDDGPRPQAVPDMEAGAAMADALLCLAAAGGRRDYALAAARALGAWGNDVRAYGALAAPHALAVLRLNEHPLHITVVGGGDDERAAALRAAALRVAAPLRTVASLDPRTDAELIAREGYRLDGPPAAYVCSTGFCSPPVTNPDALAATAADVPQ